MFGYTSATLHPHLPAASLTNKRNISSFAGTACAKAGLYAGMYAGKIAGQPVVLVTSGEKSVRGLGTAVLGTGKAAAAVDTAYAGVPVCTWDH